MHLYGFSRWKRLQRKRRHVTTRTDRHSQDEPVGWVHEACHAISMLRHPIVRVLAIASLAFPPADIFYAAGSWDVPAGNWFREAASWCAVWVSLALLFNVALYVYAIWAFSQKCQT